MNTKKFLNLTEHEGSAEFSMPVAAQNCTALGFLYGGAALATSIEVMESCTLRPTIWATTQFINFARTPDSLQIEANKRSEGRNISHAAMSAYIDKEMVFSALGSFGRREVDTQTQWATMPDLDKPENCPIFGSGKFKGDKECIDKRIEFKVARGSLRKDQVSEGQMVLWARVPEIDDICASSLALMADYLPVGAGSMLKLPAGGNSLDNSIRIVNVVPTEWVMCECDVRAIQNGVGHATMNMWSQDGVLLAVASQSFIFRTFEFKK